LTFQPVFRKFNDKSTQQSMSPVPAVVDVSGVSAAALAGLIAYLVGSFPTAFLVVRRQANIDIRSAGSGNVGALNSYEVTRSRWVGVIVLVTDFAKGSVAVLLARMLFGGQEGAVFTAAACVVLGHVASPWIGFRGGRGLATGAGALALIAWPAIALWCMTWLAGQFLFHSVNPANALASVVTLAGALVLPSVLAYPAAASGFSAVAAGVTIAVIQVMILARLIDPVREYVAGRRQKQ
jgi:glycerol-3-phosphate acyltransferase PlsY